MYLDTQLNASSTPLHGSDFYVLPCGCTCSPGMRCAHNRTCDPLKAYKFRFEGSLTIRKPNDPVLWRMRCASLEQAKAMAPRIVQGFESGKPPLDAVHRGKAIEKDMVKGEEPMELRFRVSLDALIGD